jgi:hypothetical protein
MFNVLPPHEGHHPCPASSLFSKYLRNVSELIVKTPPQLSCFKIKYLVLDSCMTVSPFSPCKFLTGRVSGSHLLGAYSNSGSDARTAILSNPFLDISPASILLCFMLIPSTVQPLLTSKLSTSLNMSCSNAFFADMICVKSMSLSRFLPLSFARAGGGVPGFR